MATQKFQDPTTGEIWENRDGRWVRTKGPDFTAEDIASETGALDAFLVGAGETFNAAANTVATAFDYATGNLGSIGQRAVDARRDQQRIAPLAEQQGLAFMAGQAAPLVAGGFAAPGSIPGVIGTEALLGGAVGFGRNLDPEEGLRDAALSGLVAGAPAAAFRGIQNRMSGRVQQSIEDAGISVQQQQQARQLNTDPGDPDIPLSETGQVPPPQMTRDDMTYANSIQSDDLAPTGEAGQRVLREQGELNGPPTVSEISEQADPTAFQQRVNDMADAYDWFRTPTMQEGSRTAQTLENLELTNPFVTTIRQRTWDQHQRQMTRQLAREVDLPNPDKWDSVTPEFIDEAMKLNGDAFDDLAKEIGTVKFDDKFFDQLDTIEGVKDISGRSRVDKELATMKDKARTYGEISGREIMFNRSRYSGLLEQARKNHPGDVPYYREIVNEIDSLIQRHASPNVTRRLAVERFRWQVLQVLQKPSVISNKGEINGVTLFNNFKRQFPRQMNRGIDTGNGRATFDQVELARHFLASPPDSGTARNFMGMLQSQAGEQVFKQMERTRQRTRASQPSLTETLENTQ